MELKSKFFPLEIFRVQLKLIHYNRLFESQNASWPYRNELHAFARGTLWAGQCRLFFKTIHIIVLQNLKPRFNVNHNHKTYPEKRRSICAIPSWFFLKVMGKEGPGPFRQRDWWNILILVFIENGSQQWAPEARSFLRLINIELGQWFLI